MKLFEGSMHILIAGGTGTIGSRLLRRLLDDGHVVTLLVRSGLIGPDPSNPRLKRVHWNGRTADAWSSTIEDADAIVNLAGASIGGGRWTTGRKRILLDSRIDATRAIVTAIGQATRRPRVLVNASAVGYYGDVPEGDITEERSRGGGFLAEVCEAWEREAMAASAHGIRVVLTRSGLVLDTRGGALPRFLLPFRLFAGGPLGPGSQWMSWIHIDDEISALVACITNGSLTGPVNLTAPQPVTMKEFCSVLGATLRRPSWFPVPSFALKLVLGEMAGPLVLEGQRVLPAKLSAAGFRFQHPSVRGALQDLLRTS